MYLKEKKILSKTKVVCNPKHALALRLRVLMLIMILKCTCSNVPKNLLIICPHPPHTPPLTTEPYCSRVSRLLHTRRIRVTSLPLRKIRDCSESAFRTTILVRLSECNDEVKHHLIGCHLSKEVLGENELILARTGLFHLAQEDKQKNVDLL